MSLGPITIWLLASSDEHTINVFRTCYHLVAGIKGGNDMRWFFTFANKPTGAMKGTLQRKPAHVKKWRRWWLIMIYNRLIILKDAME
jgi:hypothetical protein